MNKSLFDIYFGAPFDERAVYFLFLLGVLAFILTFFGDNIAHIKKYNTTIAVIAIFSAGVIADDSRVWIYALPSLAFVATGGKIAEAVGRGRNKPRKK